MLLVIGARNLYGRPSYGTAAARSAPFSRAVHRATHHLEPHKTKSLTFSCIGLSLQFIGKSRRLGKGEKVVGKKEGGSAQPAFICDRFALCAQLTVRSSKMTNGSSSLGCTGLDSTRLEASSTR